MPELGGDGGTTIAGVSDVPGLQAALDAKATAPVAQADVTGLTAALAAKAASSHAHAGSDVSSGTVAEARIDAAIARVSALSAYQAAMTAASQAEMEAGTEPTIRSMSPLRVKQAIAALGGGGSSGPGGGAQLLLDYTKSDDQAGVSITGGAWVDVTPNQTFVKQTTDGLLEVVVRGMAQLADTTGGDDFMNVRVVIDSAGTPITKNLSGDLTSDDNYHNPFNGASPIYLSGIAAGSHTVKVQLSVSGGGNFYCRPVGTPTEFLYMQVIEHNLPAAGNGGTLIAKQVYNPGSDTAVGNTTSTSSVDVDETNLAVTFVAPASGKVLVRLSSLQTASTSGGHNYWQLRVGTTVVAEAWVDDYVATSVSRRATVMFDISGLTPGASYTYKWGYRSSAGAATYVFAGGTYGPAIMEVYDGQPGAAAQATAEPWKISIPCEDLPAASVGTWAVANWGAPEGAVAHWNGGVGIASSAQNDELSWDVVVSAGTWSINLKSRKSSNVGIYTFLIDGVSVGTIDGYAAAAASGNQTITGISITRSGKVRLTVRMATKNASSSSYLGEIMHISMVRTA